MNWKTIIIHLFFWISTGWLITSGFSIERQEMEIINGVERVETIRNAQLIFKLIFCVFISAIISYINVWNLSKLNSSAHRPTIISRSVLIYLVGLAVLVISNQFSNTLRLPLSLLAGITLFYYTISIAYGLTRMWIKTDRNQRQLQLEKKQAEINLMRNQLQPHFLFNALNNLLSMVDQQSAPKLARSFEGLSQLLRYVIDETKSDEVSIQQEIDFTKNYISLQLLRFETDEVNVDLQVSGDYNNQKVEPGLFISFVENAFKYGTEPEKKTSIEIRFDISQSNQIFFSTMNEVLDSVSKTGNGTGIETVRKRLALVYPERHSLEIKSEDLFEVNLKLETT
ncbi:sensor histidine kinase [Ekhidna sp.]|uniref:sensor histidine kinase n=1 Tax=Ekhidna sp. TaxID=2608089 RepID=UPI003B5AA569